MDGVIRKGKGKMVYEEEEVIENEEDGDAQTESNDGYAEISTSDDAPAAEMELDDGPAAQMEPTDGTDAVHEGEDVDYSPNISDEDADDMTMGSDDEHLQELLESAGKDPDYVRSDEEVDPIETEIETINGTEGTSDEFVKGMRFDSKDQIRDLATAYAVDKHKDLSIRRSDKKRVCSVCRNHRHNKKTCSFKAIAIAGSGVETDAVEVGPNESLTDSQPTPSRNRGRCRNRGGGRCRGRARGAGRPEGRGDLRGEENVTDYIDTQQSGVKTDAQT